MNHGNSEDRIKQKLLDAKFLRSEEIMPKSCEDCAFMKIGISTDNTVCAICDMLSEFIISPGKWESCALHSELMNCGCRFFKSINLKTNEMPKYSGDFIAMLNDMLSHVPSEEHDEFYRAYVQADIMIHDLEKFADLLPDNVKSDYYARLNELRLYIRTMILREEEEEEDDGEEEEEENSW